MVSTIARASPKVFPLIVIQARGEADQSGRDCLPRAGNPLEAAGQKHWGREGVQASSPIRLTFLGGPISAG
jgi:hypothetical protein